MLKESNVLNLKDLCIEEGKAVWSLWIDVVCVSYDGNIYDAALTSVMAALGNGKKLWEYRPRICQGREPSPRSITYG